MSYFYPGIKQREKCEFNVTSLNISGCVLMKQSMFQRTKQRLFDVEINFGTSNFGKSDFGKSLKH